MFRRTTAVALALVATLTLVAGCSSSDSSDASSGDAKTSTTAKGGSGSDSGTGSGDETTTTAKSGGGDVSGDLDGSFCDMAKQLETAGDDILGTDATTDTSPAGQLESIRKLFGTLDTIYGKLNEDPPAAIADEIGLLADFAASNAKKVNDATTYEEAAKVAQAAFGTGSTEIEKAGNTIAAYAKDECGVVPTN